MREIKFRAWDTSEENKPYMLGPYDLTDAIWNHKDIRKLPLMQYTGLKDKNGKEIYEGDIIEYYDEFSIFGGKVIGKIGFKDAAFTIETEEETYILHTTYPFCTVIGSIHENPELLTTKTKTS
jgi:uncharacterized phage protein (TIGR01671 family)